MHVILGIMGWHGILFCRELDNKGRKGNQMKFCEKCGAKLGDGMHFCPACGVVQKGMESQSGDAGNRDGTESRVVAALAYLGPLVFVAFCLAKGEKFVRFHVNQGIVLLLASVVYGITSGVLERVILEVFWRAYFFTGVIGLAGLVFPVLACVGIANAVNGRKRELPVIGRIRVLR